VPPEPGPSSTMFLVPILGTMVGIMIFFNIWHMEAAMFDFLEVNCGFVNQTGILGGGDCVLIAAISTIGASLKLWVGVTNLYILCRRNIVNWQKQYINWGFVYFDC